MEKIMPLELGLSPEIEFQIECGKKGFEILQKLVLTNEQMNSLPDLPPKKDIPISQLKLRKRFV